MSSQLLRLRLRCLDQKCEGRQCRRLQTRVGHPADSPSVCRSHGNWKRQRVLPCFTSQYRRKTITRTCDELLNMSAKWCSLVSAICRSKGQPHAWWRLLKQLSLSMTNLQMCHCIDVRIARLAESDTTIEPGAQIGSHRAVSNLEAHRSHPSTGTAGLARCIVLCSGVSEARGSTELFGAGVSGSACRDASRLYHVRAQASRTQPGHSLFQCIQVTR